MTLPLMPLPMTLPRRGALCLALAAAALCSACAPLLMGTAVMGTGLVYTDRRTSGAQVEDQAIEIKGASRVREAIAGRGNISITSYNRLVLITGEAETEADKVAAEQVVSRVDNVRSTVNEVAVTFTSSIASRSRDTIITSKVKAGFIDAADLQANAFKVVTERSVVYLLGRVTEREAARAAEVARTVGGVAKVVRVVELLSEAELANLQQREAPKK